MHLFDAATGAAPFRKNMFSGYEDNLATSIQLASGAFLLMLYVLQLGFVVPINFQVILLNFSY
jgi:hypothetical protein